MNRGRRCLIILFCVGAVPLLVAVSQVETAATAPAASPAPAANDAPAGAADFRETAPPQWSETPASTPEPKPEAQPPQALPAYFQAHQQIWAETPAPASADQPASTPSLLSSDATNYFLRAVAILLILCGVIILGGYLVKRFGKRTPLLAGQRLGTVLGRIHLTPRASLHYVKSGDRVLVIGLTQNNVSLITEFDADTFETATNAEPDTATQESGRPANFLAQLRAAARPEPKPTAPVDDDLASLRSDIQRLQQYLQDSARETSE